MCSLSLSLLHFLHVFAFIYFLFCFSGVSAEKAMFTPYRKTGDLSKKTVSKFENIEHEDSETYKSREKNTGLPLHM